MDKNENLTRFYTNKFSNYVFFLNYYLILVFIWLNCTCSLSCISTLVINGFWVVYLLENTVPEDHFIYNTNGYDKDFLHFTSDWGSEELSLVIEDYKLSVPFTFL